MKRFFKIAGIVIGSVFVIAILLGFFWFKDVILVEKKTPKELASILTPHFIIKHPPGDGPFPTVISFHGADGLYFYPERGKWKHYDNWADYFVSLGYASIFVDSFTGRDIITPDDASKLGSGRILWGTERAGDVLVAIDEVRKMSFVDPNRLALVGWSHGSWSIMSLLSLDLPDKLPPNLITVPSGIMDGVKGAVAFYPYFPPRMMSSNGENWNNSIKTLVLMGNKDPLTESCLESISILEKNNNPISYHIYPDVDHSYTLLPEDVKHFPESYQQQLMEKIDSEATADSRKRVKNFLEDVFK